MTSNLIVFSYPHHDDDQEIVEFRQRAELTPQHVTERLTGALRRVREGTAHPNIAWHMMNALVTAYTDHDLPLGPDAPPLLDDLRTLCLPSCRDGHPTHDGWCNEHGWDCADYELEHRAHAAHR
ncbi:hypothetical protein ACFWYW_46870 [Nonomuraea sp. NPDC059023]|uniref:hypothetical protein n=1 Tax=unclassified Nonomuraea TaxID=2593643 RepID=UPI00368E42F3